MIAALAQLEAAGARLIAALAQLEAAGGFVTFIYGVRGRLRYVYIWCAWDAHPPLGATMVARHTSHIYINARPL